MGVKKIHNGVYMDTLKIKIVLAAAKYGSLSRAAEEFSYTPSAFSHTLKSFEKSLGVEIFKRSSVGVELSDAGRELLPYFEAMIECEEDIMNVSREISQKSGGQLRIATYSSISRNLLTGLIRDFRRDFPDITLSVNVVDSVRGWLENGRADIVFADSGVLLKNEFYPIMQDEYFAVAPTGWFDGRESINYEELYKFPYIDTCDFHSDVDFNPERFKERILFKSEDDLSVINMVREGMGVTVLPELVLKKNLDGVSVLKLEPKITRTLGFAYKKQSPKTMALSKFIKYIKSVKL
ncbi:MAG: LysR family transcriptional regulator [Ruminococcaceae bacterium]|nr:LysR family transcriptional regulator [Oscillospiraceae bacterium]